MGLPGVKAPDCNTGYNSMYNDRLGGPPCRHHLRQFFVYQANCAIGWELRDVSTQIIAMSHDKLPPFLVALKRKSKLIQDKPWKKKCSKNPSNNKPCNQKLSKNNVTNKHHLIFWLPRPLSNVITCSLRPFPRRKHLDVWLGWHECRKMEGLCP